MKGKILSYLLIGLFAFFVSGQCFIYVEAAGSSGRGELNQPGGGGGGGGGDQPGGGGGGGGGDQPGGGGGGGGGDQPGGGGGGGGGDQPGGDGGSKCNGIKLNTNFPGIGNCISYKEGESNPTDVFPRMMSTLTKFIMSIILVVCFVAIIVAGIIWAGAGGESGKVKTAQGIIEKVAITILLLGFSGVILRLINPNFFG